VVAQDYTYMCSAPGQKLLAEAVKEHKLTGVVVTACSPQLHEPTFRGAAARAGLNPFCCEMANVREQCSWVTKNGDSATQKAKRLIAAAVKRVLLHEPLDAKDVPINPDTLIVGAGIAGIEAALKIAGAGRTVHLVEREPTIGGQMTNFDKTFPTLDCAACILTPKMVSVAQNPNIRLRTYAEVESVSGYVGNFKVRIRKKARYVDLDKCTGCGACWDKCLGMRIPSNRVIRKGDTVINQTGGE